jgi:hypothetical protein
MKQPFVLLFLFLFVSWACQGGGKAPGAGKEAAPGGKAGVSLKALEAGGGWKRLNPVGPFMTSPSWLPDGSGIIAFGWKGMGLFAAGAGDGQIENLGSDLRPPLVWGEGKKSFCVRQGKGSAHFDFDGASGKIIAAGGRSEACRVKQGPGETESTLYDEGGLVVIQDQRTSSLKILREGKETLVEDHGAWGVAVSPGGGRIAYSTGPLKESTLQIYDPAKGRTTVGRGAYPSWFPGGKSIVYAAPEADVSPSGEARIARSELYIYNVETSKSVRLTDTRDIIEMQPSISPSGDKVAFSDWQGGGLFIIPAGKEAAK